MDPDSSDPPAEEETTLAYLERRLRESAQIVLAAQRNVSVDGRALGDEMVRRVDEALNNLGFFGGKFDSSAFTKYAMGDPSGLLGTKSANGSTANAETGLGAIFTARKQWHAHDSYTGDMNPRQIDAAEKWSTSNTAMKECMEALIHDSMNVVRFLMHLHISSEELLNRAVKPTLDPSGVMDIEIPSAMNSSIAQEEWRQFGADFIVRQYQTPFIVMAIDTRRETNNPKGAVQDARITQNPSYYDTRRLPEEAFPGLSHADKSSVFQCRIIATSNVYVEKYLCAHTGRDEYRARPRTRYARDLIRMGRELVVYPYQRTVLYTIDDVPQIDKFDDQWTAQASFKGGSISDPTLISFHGPFDAMSSEWAKTNANENFQLAVTSSNAREAALVEQPAPVLQGLDQMLDGEKQNVLEERMERAEMESKGQLGDANTSFFGQQVVTEPVASVSEYTRQDQERLAESRRHRQEMMGSEADATMTEFSNASGPFREEAPMPKSKFNWHDTAPGDPITPYSRTLTDIGEQQWQQLHARSANLNSNPYTWFKKVRVDLPIGTKLAAHVRPTYVGPNVKEDRRDIETTVRSLFKINDIRLQRGGGKASFSISSGSSGRSSASKSDAAVNMEIQTWEDRVQSTRMDVARALVWVYEEIVALQERRAAKQRAQEQSYWAGVQLRMLTEAAQQSRQLDEALRRQFSKLKNAEAGFAEKCNYLLERLAKVTDEAVLHQTNYRHLVQNLVIALLQSNGLVTLEIKVEPVPLLVPEQGKQTTMASSSEGKDTTLDGPAAKRAKVGDVGQRALEEMKENEEESIMLQARAKAFGKK